MLLATVFLLATALAQQPPAPTPPDAGEIDGHTYTSKYFGFTYTLPGDLTARVPSGDGEDPTVHPSAYILLRARVPETGQTAVSIVAQPLAAEAGIKTPADYFASIDPGLKRRGAQVERTAAFTQQGHQFGREEMVTRSASGGHLYQVYFVTLGRGYAVVFLLTGHSPEQRDELASSIASVAFTTPAK